jgi:aerobic-type carbon monoxide dehydrogenase small subunit (CoxS/CutS family)
MRLKVNGKYYDLNLSRETPLLWALRENSGLPATKYSCGLGECGACTVLVDDKPVFSCVTTISEVQDQEVVTLEGLEGPVGEEVQKAWITEQVPQCGFCQPGQIMTAVGLLKEHPRPQDKDIEQAMGYVLCRCGTYQEIKKAIKRAAKEVGRV